MNKKVYFVMVGIMIGLFLSAIVSSCGGGSGIPPVYSGDYISASQVVFDNSKTTLSGETLQEAINETEPRLSDVLVGTWTGQVIKLRSKVSENGEHFEAATFSITFEEGGNFTAEGPMEAFGWIYDSNFPNYTPNTWEIYNQELSISYVMEEGHDPVPHKGKIIKLKNNYMKVIGYDGVVCELQKQP